ncbi:THUMP domain-containing protein [Methanobacterium alcaliphilum]|uniref:THUMP domain-containing protein n=1 Tax=Methanobacterium alcaliphilum TaxID=392018 RepID=UPI00200A1030|nr:THUMP domain-containing protein [Methanobacterium alcaliphilum]MCK9150966.1 THUMP domain-containing protein [Methanobacterium alcaliphilum]
MQPTENFNLLITLQGQKGENTGEEVLGMEEIELALQNKESNLNFKETKFPNVILIDLNIDPKEVVQILKNAPTTVISKVVPMETVTRTRLSNILEKTMQLTGSKLDHGETITVRCDLRGKKYIESKENLIKHISDELSDKLNLSINEKNPDWVVQVEVVGENTGISVLREEDILKKS